MPTDLPTAFAPRAVAEPTASAPDFTSLVQVSVSAVVPSSDVQAQKQSSAAMQARVRTIPVSGEPLARKSPKCVSASHGREASRVCSREWKAAGWEVIPQPEAPSLMPRSSSSFCFTSGGRLVPAEPE